MGSPTEPRSLRSPSRGRAPMFLQVESEGRQHDGRLLSNSESDSEGSYGSESEAEEEYRPAPPSLATRLKVITSFFQLSSTIVNEYGLSYPELVNNIAGVFSVGSVSVFTFVVVGCGVSSFDQVRDCGLLGVR
jgi:hypothetical protein